MKRRSTSARFRPEFFGFLVELALNNNREWFHDNKDFYERAVKRPLLEFIEDFSRELAKLSTHFVADARSMFRIYRDVRFSKDKRPYKTHAAAHFRHEASKDVHAPGFYLHMEPGSVFVGGGVWRPGPEELRAIRTYLARNPSQWRQVVDAPHFKKRCELHGESLTRSPRGFDPEHPLADDIRRKDFIAMVQLKDQTVTSADFVSQVADACRVVAPLNSLICAALGLPY